MPFPENFGRYRLLSELGRGAFSVVYDAEDTQLGRRVAIKILSDADGSALERFQREARIAATLDHDGVVRVFDVGVENGRHYLTMQPVRGGDLLAWVRRSRPDYRERARALERVARAVHAAHLRGIIHRDLKPSNILMDDGDRPVVTDFGVARQIDSTTRLTWTGELLGTPLYMSPEQLAGRTADAKSDVYSLGVVLYETIAGDVPFEASSFAQLTQKVMHDETPRLSTRAADVPRDLEVLCHKALAREPSERYASAESFADDLWRFAGGLAIIARPPGLVRRLRVFVRRHPVAAILLAVVVAVGSYALWRRADVRREAKTDLERGLSSLHAHQYPEARALLSRVDAQALGPEDRAALAQALLGARGAGTLRIDAPGATIAVTDDAGVELVPGVVDPGFYRVRAAWNDPHSVAFDFRVRVERKETWMLTLRRVERRPGMIFIPAVDFLFGDPPQRHAGLRPFYIDEREVTVREFMDFVDATKHAFDVSSDDMTLIRENPTRPMPQVRYADATAYAAYVKKRLPTEEEWELAARGLDGRDFPWGNERDAARTVCSEGTKIREFPLVRTPPADTSVFGVRDTAGNVMEWTTSIYSRKGDLVYRVVRGGHFKARIEDCLVTQRHSAEQGFRNWALGFRCVVDAPENP